MIRHLAGMLAALFIANAAAAHEFTVVLIVPEAAQQAARQAFLLASSERDGHPDETSEGHLGGLDSQLEIIAPGMALPTAQIVVAIAPATLPPTGPGTWAFSLAAIGARERSLFLGGGDSSFAARHAARYGMPPDATATRTYVAARLIDKAVRAQGGADDPRALAAALEN